MRIRETIADFEVRPWTVYDTCRCGHDPDCETCHGMGSFVREVTSTEFTMALLAAVKT